MRKRIISVLLVVCMALFAAACGDDNKPSEEKITLSAPADLRIIDQGDQGLVHWEAVKNAQSYIVTVNGVENTTQSTSWIISPLTIDYTVTVVACREGCKNSDAATVNFHRHGVTVTISGGSECRSGKSLKLSASVSEVENQSVTWRIVSGGEYAEISADGSLAAKNVSGDKIVRVRATSVFDSTAYAEKAITITAKPELTQEMLDELDSDKLAFEGFVDLEQWTSSMPGQLVGSASLGVSTAMDGRSWFSEYDDVTSKKRYDYIVDSADIDGRPSTACKVSVDLDNNEQVAPITVDGQYVAWADAGYANGLRDLALSDFAFNESNWRWEYTAKDADAGKAKMQAVISSAVATDFEPKNMYLIVEDGAVAGIYAESEDDYDMYTDYRVRKKLTAAINVGETVEVPEFAKFEHKEMHDDLQAAINKMRALDSYTAECLDNSTTMSGGTVMNGYVETVTSDVCYMRPFEFTPFQASLVEIGSGSREFSNMDFGYFKCDETLFNSFRVNNGAYSTFRAFIGDFDVKAKPSFAFAAEIFTDMVQNSDGSKTYYADKKMTAVATALYRGLGNEMDIYGIFANHSYRAKAYLPYVTVNADGYISGAGFSYYLGTAYGELKMEYRNFGRAVLDDAVAENIAKLKAAPRAVPDGWDKISVKIDGDAQQTATVLDRLKLMFDEDIADRLPYISAAVGDTYNDGRTDFRSIVVDGKRVPVDSLTLFFEVPFDIDYSIDSSLAAVDDFLNANGFTENSNGVYIKGNISVLPEEDEMRLFVYIWNNSPTL